MTSSTLTPWHFGVRYNSSFYSGLLMLRRSPLLLFLTLPLLSSTPYAGLPLWAWGSLGASLLYAIVLIFSIEREWDEESNDE
jgi:hypothetical protein